MSERDYSAFITRALFLDQPDPIAAWRELSQRQAKLVARLSSAREVRLQAPDTDLRLRVDGRTWINSDGRRNMPSGEVFHRPTRELGDRSRSVHGVVEPERGGGDRCRADVRRWRGSGRSG